MSKPILVVGGGIAGLSFAIAMGRRGRQVEIAELNPAWDVYGVGLILQSYALRVLDYLGLAEECINAAFPYSFSRHFDRDGKPLHARRKPSSEQSHLPASCGILRPVLHELLRRTALQLGTQVRLGVSVSALNQSEGGVDVLFTDGSRERYDLVIGADGLRSTVRRLVFNANLAPRFTGQACWRFTMDRPEGLDCTHMYHGEHKIAGFVPVSREQMYLMLLTEEPGNPHMPRKQLAELMRMRLGGFAEPVDLALLNIPPAEQIVYRPIETLLTPPPWAKGRIALMGDAAHATTPHLALGATMALEDAMVLANLLDDSTDPEAALAAYSVRRYPRCKRVTDASAQIGEWQMNEDPAANPLELAIAVTHELMEPA